MTSCPHEDVRRYKVAVADGVVLLCEECKDTWSEDTLAHVTAAETESLRPPPLVDHERLAGELYDLIMLREEAEFHTEVSSALRHLVRDELWRIKGKYELTWQNIGDILGMNRKTLQNTANYMGHDQTKHTNHRKVSGRFSDRALAYHAKARRRLVERTFVPPEPRVFSPYALCKPDVCDHDPPGSSDQGEPGDAGS